MEESIQGGSELSDTARHGEAFFGSIRPGPGCDTKSVQLSKAGEFGIHLSSGVFYILYCLLDDVRIGNGHREIWFYFCSACLQ